MELELKWYQADLTDTSGLKYVSSTGHGNTLPEVVSLSFYSVPIKELKLQPVQGKANHSLTFVWENPSNT